MDRFVVDSKFRDKIPPLTEAEFEQLRENILADGEVYEPIAVWNGTIVDGHNRWRIIQEHPEIPYKVKEMEFADEWDAFEWMYRKQLGRRNLTAEQRKYMIGKMYEARKKSVGAPEGNTNNLKVNADKMSKLKSRREIKDGTSGQIGKEFGVTGKTVRRAEFFAKGVDAISEVSPEAATKVLLGKADASQDAVAELKDAPKETVKRFADRVMADEKLRATKAPRPVSKEMKEFSQKLNDIVEVMEGEGKEYSTEDAVNDLNSAKDMFVMQVRFVLTEKAAVINNEQGREEFENFIKSVIDDLNRLKGELK